MTQPVHFDDYSIQCHLSEDEQEAAISITLDLQVESTCGVVVQSALALDGLPAAEVSDSMTLRPGNRSLVQSLTVRHPRLWTPSSPTLYTAGTGLRDENGRLMEVRRGRCAISGVRVNPADARSWAVRCSETTARLTGWLAPNDSDPYLLAKELSDENNCFLAFRAADPRVVEDVLERCDEFGVLALPLVPQGAESNGGFLEPVIRAGRGHPSKLAWALELPLAADETVRELLALEDPLSTLQSYVGVVDPYEAALSEAALNFKGRPSDSSLWEGYLGGRAAELEARRRFFHGRALHRWHPSVAFRAPFQGHLAEFIVGASLDAEELLSHDRLRGEAWVLSRDRDLMLMNVLVLVQDPAGRTLYQECHSADAEASRLLVIGEIFGQLPSDVKGPLAMTLEVIDEEGETRCHSLRVLSIPKRSP